MRPLRRRALGEHAALGHGAPARLRLHGPLAILTTLLEEVLNPRFVPMVVDRTLRAFAPEAQGQELRRLDREGAQLDTELLRLTQAIAQGGDVPVLVESIKARQATRTDLLAAADALRQRVVRLDRTTLEAEIHRRLEDWRGLLGRHVEQARQILRKLLIGPIVLETDVQPVPVGQQRRSRRAAARYAGQVSYGKLFAGILDIPTSVASPTGLEPVLPA